MSSTTIRDEGFQTVEKLTRTNWFNWSFSMESFLTIKDLWEVVEETTVPEDVENANDSTDTKEAKRIRRVQREKEDKKAKSYIRMRVESEFTEAIRDCKTAKQTWKTLYELNSSKSITNRM